MSEDLNGPSQDELWLCHLSCESWCEPERWNQYFGAAEKVLGSHITHLDKNDPVRRRVKPGNFRDIAEYITSMGKHEDSRWVFGKIEGLGTEFKLQHYRNVRGWSNTLDWYFPPGFADKAAGGKVIRALFGLGNATLSPFYAFADTKVHVSSKKKQSGSVNIQAELIGVFWLCYFDAHYVAFIGKDRLNGLNGVNVMVNSGATLDLGDTPSSVREGLRNEVEVSLGSNLFVDPKAVIAKRPGQYALTFDQLRT
jgi:hypothetical protein